MNWITVVDKLASTTPICLIILIIILIILVKNTKHKCLQVTKTMLSSLWSREGAGLTPCFAHLWHRLPLPWSRLQAAPGEMTHTRTHIYIKNNNKSDPIKWHVSSRDGHWCVRKSIQRAWFVPVSRLMSDLIPPLLQMVTLLAGIWANSPRAPTTFTSTSSGWSISRPTRLSKVLYSWNLRVLRGDGGGGQGISPTASQSFIITTALCRTSTVC